MRLLLWCSKNRLVLNYYGKTIVLKSYNRQNPNKLLTFWPKINGNTLVINNSISYPRLTITKMLNWGQHIENITKTKGLLV